MRAVQMRGRGRGGVKEEGRIPAELGVSSYR